MATYKKQIGIWLDYKEAFIISLDQEKGAGHSMKHVLSDIEWGVPKGGSRSKTPWGPQGGTDERAFRARRLQEEKTYYAAVISEIDPSADELMVFGPAEAKIGLEQAIKAIKQFHPELKAVRTADSMTENQMVAEVKQYFAEKVTS